LFVLGVEAFDGHLALTVRLLGSRDTKMECPKQVVTTNAD